MAAPVLLQLWTGPSYSGVSPDYLLGKVTLCWHGDLDVAAGCSGSCVRYACMSYRAVKGVACVVVVRCRSMR